MQGSIRREAPARIEIGTHSIAYRLAGAGPPLVLLHGFLCDSRVWRRELNGLSDHFMVVAWDAPGAGASSDPREPFTITDWATCLERFLDAVDVEAPTSWACRGAASWRKSCIACIRTGS